MTQAAADPLDGYDPGPPPPLDPVASREEVTATITPIEAGAERSVLAAVMASASVYDDVCDKLTPGDFGAPAHEAIFSAIVSCDAQGRPFDPVTVADEMRRAGTLNRSGGEAYLADLMRRASSAATVAEHVEILRDRSLRRRMVTAANTIGAAALNPQMLAQQALDVAEQQVFELGAKRAESSLAPMAQVIAKTQAEMAKARTAKLVGYSTGLEALDDATGGLRGGQFVIVCARPGMGKSILALQIAAHIAEVEDVTVPYFSYEMTHEELGLRLLSSRTGIRLSELSRGQLPSGDGMDRVFAREVEKLSGLRLMIDDRPPATITALRSEIRRLARRGPLGAVVVDYIQLINGDGGRRDENRTQEVSAISRMLKQLAVELDVPVIAVSQLSRSLESRTNRRPIPSDLRESGALEQDANLIIALYRDWMYDKSQPEDEAEILILKNRQGRLADLAATFDGPCVRFRDSDRVLDTGGTGAPPAPAGGFGGGGGARVTRSEFF